MTGARSSGGRALIRRGVASLHRRLGLAGRGGAHLPANINRRDASPQAIAADVDYALQVIRGFEWWMQGAGFDIKGARVVELGPGVNLAGVLGLKALGAGEAVAVDRWLAPWQGDYSPVFCGAMAARIRAEEPAWDAGVFERAARSGDTGLVTRVPVGAEQLAEFLQGQVDAVFSNAVLEHIADHAAMARSLAQVTRIGGMGFHQVDFRFHGDFSRPLDHMLDPPKVHARRAQASFYEMGCQLRPTELAQLFEDSGFETDYRPGQNTEPVYFAEFIKALRGSRSAYRHAAEDMMRPTDAFYVLRRR